MISSKSKISQNFKNLGPMLSIPKDFDVFRELNVVKMSFSQHETS